MFYSYVSIVRDKTVFERKLLLAYHTELDNRRKAGETYITIIYRNGILYV